MHDFPQHPLAMAVNAATRGTLFGEWFTTRDTRDAGAWDSYGYAHALNFEDYYTMYSRLGIANALINMIVDKCWQTDPRICTEEGTHEPNQWERRFNALADRLSLWERLQGLDWRQRIGRYAGLIMFVDDGKPLSEPLMRMPSERSLVDVRPFVEGQLEPVEYDQDQNSPRYGLPITFQVNQQSLGDKNTGMAGLSATVHHSRVIVWAEGADDGTIYGTPTLEPVFNSLVTLERIIGAGGVGYWKAARQSPVMNLAADANLAKLAQMLGTDLEGLPDAVDEQIQRWQKGYDQALMTQGFDVQALSFNVPSPKDFAANAMMDVAAHPDAAPMTIMIGQQTGRLASDEDQSQWAQTAEARRAKFLDRAIKATILRFIELGFLPDTPSIYVEWESLQEPSPADKLELGKKMAEIIKGLVGTGVEAPFTAEEIREMCGFEPMEEMLDAPEGGDDELLVDEQGEQV